VTSQAVGVSQITAPVKNRNGRYIVQALFPFKGTFRVHMSMPSDSSFFEFLVELKKDRVLEQLFEI
jgi:hypothetical protein